MCPRVYIESYIIFNEFLIGFMQDYTFYIAATYIISISVIAGLIWHSIIKYNRIMHRIAQDTDHET